jgi:hypothetical protein
METIPLWNAIAEMRRLTEAGETFSFVHASYDRDKQITQGIRVVHKAKLRPAAPEEKVQNADHKLFYYDIVIREPRVCWQPLIMYFNGKKVIPG